VPIRVVLADDHYLVREGVRGLLGAEPDIEVVAVCSDLGSLLDAVDDNEPDVVVTDIRMPPGNTDEGIQAADRLRGTHPGVGVVVLSQYATPSFALALLAHARLRALAPVLWRAFARNARRRARLDGTVLAPVLARAFAGTVRRCDSRDSERDS